MCDFSESSQLLEWMFTSPSMLERCRGKANQLAREELSKPKDDQQESSKNTAAGALPPVQDFACGYAKRSNKKKEKKESKVDPTTIGPWENPSGHPYLKPEEEELLVAFYASKLPSLIGPTAQIGRLRRESKVMATAAMFLRRFFLSNSVMIHDPKAVMVAAAFLATKVEDVMVDVRYLEDGTNLMNAPVAMSEILPAELCLMNGIHCQLQCYHPFKSVVALTEDLRTFLKSEKGIVLVESKRISGEDLKPLYDGARAILDDVIVSDIPMLFTPGQIGLAAMMVANENLQAKQKQQKEKEKEKKEENKDDNEEKASTEEEETSRLPPLDLLAYIKLRFSPAQGKEMQEIMVQLIPLLKGLKEGKHGCGNHNVDMVQLKAVHKKLKKCRVWGNKKDKKDKKGDKKDKKNKKRSSPGGGGGGGGDEPKSKKAKT